MPRRLRPPSLRAVVALLCFVALAIAFYQFGAREQASQKAGSNDVTQRDTIKNEASVDEARKYNVASNRANPVHASRLQRDVQNASSVLQAENLRHNFTTYFLPNRVVVLPSAGESSAWELSLHTRSVGRRTQQPVAKANPESHGNRASYARGDVLEYYENRPDGLEHVIEVATRPEAATDGPLLVDVDIDGLIPHIVADDGISLRDTNGTTRLTYDKLYVVDARKQPLSARFVTTAQGRIRISVDDSDAVYPITIDPRIAVPQWTYDGLAGNSYLGHSVVGGADFNCDGEDDVVITRGDFNSSSSTLLGFYGSSSGLAAVADWTVTLPPRVGYAYTDLAVGNFTGDGCDDLLVGYVMVSGVSRAILFLGTPVTGLAPAHSWESDFGHVSTVANAGDVNGDTIDDILVGAPENGSNTQGEVALFLGGNTNGGNPETTPWWSRTGPFFGDRLGYVVSGAGDINNDGYADFMTAVRPVSQRNQHGEAWGFHGGVSVSVTPNFQVGGIQTAFMGISAAGDLNNDDFDDVLISSWGNDGSTVNIAGTVEVYTGTATGLETSAPLQFFSNSNARSWFGYAMAPLGDINNDGYVDIAVGAPRFSESAQQLGAVYIYNGTATGLELGSSAYDESKSSQLGWSVSGAGNVNDDAYGDVIVGAPNDAGFNSNEGMAIVYYGDDQNVISILACASNSECPTNHLCVAQVCTLSDGLLGDACDENDDCIEGACSNNGFAGTCGGRYAACVINQDCDAGDSLTCLTGFCDVSLGDFGDDCDDDDDCAGTRGCSTQGAIGDCGGENASCADDPDCDVTLDLVCVIDTCLRNYGLAENPCDEDVECDSPYKCSSDGTTPGTCGGGGAQCTSSAECSGNNCDLDHNRCGSVNYPCANPTHCINGTVCNGSNICEATNGALADRCDNDDDCMQGTCSCSSYDCYCGGIGALCNASSDCVAGTRCVNDACVVSNGNLWEPCGVNSDCQNPGTVRCIVNTCWPSAGGVGEACDENLDCTSSACSASPGMGACGDTGAACTMNSECTTFNRCIDDACASSDGSLSAACDSDDDCTGANCSQQGSLGSCGTAGAVCADDPNCASGHRCVVNVCEASTGGASQPCDEDSDCSSGECSANGSAGTCRAEGSDCDFNYECTNGTTCIMSVCTISSGGLNEPCDETGDCTSSFCSGDGYVGTCGGLGSGCFVSGQCYQSNCSFAMCGGQFAACTTDANCTDGSLCISGQCRINTGRIGDVCGQNNQCTQDDCSTSGVARTYTGANYAGAVPLALGDVNCDGYDDLGMAFPSHSNPGGGTGQLWFHRGGANGVEAAPFMVIPNPMGNPVWTQFGRATARMGDIDNGGCDDYAVAMNTRAFIYLGEGGWNPWFIQTNNISSILAGDFTGDSNVDIIVGDDDSRQLFIYHWPWPAGSSPTAILMGPTLGFGAKLAYAGDINNDSYGDLLVAAPGSIGQVQVSPMGAAHVLFGSPSGLSLVGMWTDESEHPGDSFGHSIAALGDINGDGFAEIAVGSHTRTVDKPEQGVVQIYQGAAFGPTATPIWTLTGQQPYEHFGYSISGGDLNGDGYGDLTVASRRFDTRPLESNADEGAVFVYFGSASGLVTTPAWIGSTSPANLVGLTGITSEGDFNNDGLADTAAVWELSTNAQRVEVFRGRNTCERLTECVGGSCTASTGSPGNSCDDDSDCDAANCLTGMCGRVGADCQDNDECVASTTCFNDICTTSTRALGAVCDDHDDCAASECSTATGLGTCGGDGADCVDDANCASGTRCVADVCTTSAGALGDACDETADCVSSACTVTDGSAAGVCGGDGAACADDPACVSSTRCVAGTCDTSAGNLGQACDETADCGATLACTVVDGSSAGTCGGTGADCTSDATCVAGSPCIVGECTISNGSLGAACDESAHCTASACTITDGSSLGTCGGDGALCTDDPNCAGGTRCVAGTCDTTTGALGQPCDESADCTGANCTITDSSAAGTCGGDGAVCTDDPNCNTGSRCVAGTCDTSAGLLGQACDESSDCTASNCTITDGSSSGVCGGNGAVCSDDPLCASGTRCVAGTCSTSSGALGQACDESADCAASNCTITDGSGVGSCGGATAVCGDDPNCASGNLCVAGACRSSAGALGEACDETADCASASCSITDSSAPGTCGGDGAICVNDTTCDAGTRCVAGTCETSNRLLGAACDASADCLSGTCSVTDGSAAGTCGGLGALCTVAGDCTSGLCHGSTSPVCVAIIVTDPPPVVNRVTVDSDGDGISDTLEANALLNPFAADTDGDGIVDAVEFGPFGWPLDTDGDGIINALDLDSDNDGYPDSTERLDDMDRDGVPDYVDWDNSRLLPYQVDGGCLYSALPTRNANLMVYFALFALGILRTKRKRAR